MSKCFTTRLQFWSLYIKGIIFLFAILLYSSSSLAENDQEVGICSKTLSQATTSVGEFEIGSIGLNWRSFDLYQRFNYDKFNRILFLSDGERSFQIRNKDKSKLLISSDFSADRAGHLRLDNNHLPFAPESFNLIVMNRGLCPCHSNTKTCGGIEITEQDFESFFSSVANLLIKSDSTQSLALMTGYYFPNSAGTKALRNIRHAVKSLQSKYSDLSFAILEQPSIRDDDSLIGVAIYSKGKDIAKLLKNLVPR